MKILLTLALSPFAVIGALIAVAAFFIIMPICAVASIVGGKDELIF